MTFRISLDTETLGISRGSVILQIAAVDIDEPERFYNSYVSRESCRKAGLTEDKSTIDWWGKQDPEVKNRVFSGTSFLGQALYGLSEFVLMNKALGEDIEVWMNSPSFDCEKILAPAYQVCQFTIPWEFWQERDFRTLKNLTQTYLGMNYVPRAGAHDALVDALSQAEYIKKVTTELAWENFEARKK